MARSFLIRLENETTFTAGRPALAAYRAWPEAARAHVRCAIVDRDWVVGAWAPVVVRVISGGIVASLGVRTRAGGMGGQPCMGGADGPPREGVAIIVEEAVLDGVAGWGPHFGGLFRYFGVWDTSSTLKS